MLLLTLVVFGIGTVAFINNNKLKSEEYFNYLTEHTTELRELSESNLTELAVNEQLLILEPRGNAFIDDSREKLLPLEFEYSGYNVFGFEIPLGSTNPYLQSFQELNWSYIVSIIISFTVLLLTFDSISKEKESKTLAVSLANPVSRGTLLLGKYLSAIITTLLVTLPGMCLSLVIILISGKITINMI